MSVISMKRPIPVTVDPLPGLWQQLLAAREVFWTAEGAVVDVERDMREAGFIPRVQIGTYQARPDGTWPSARNGGPIEPGTPIYAATIDQIPRGTKACDALYPARVDEFERSVAKRTAEEERRGLPALFAASEAADKEVTRLDYLMRDTEPTTLAGLIAKLRYLQDLVAAESNLGAVAFDDLDWDDQVWRRVLADAERLATTV